MPHALQLMYFLSTCRRWGFRPVQRKQMRLPSLRLSNSVLTLKLTSRPLGKKKLSWVCHSQDVSIKSVHCFSSSGSISSLFVSVILPNVGLLQCVLDVIFIPQIQLENWASSQAQLSALKLLRNSYRPSFRTHANFILTSAELTVTLFWQTDCVRIYQRHLRTLVKGTQQVQQLKSIQSFNAFPVTEPIINP